MIDSKKVLYLPKWVKVLTVISLSVCLAASIAVSITFIGKPGHADWILLSMSIAQLAATALIFSLLLIFGEREANIDILREKTNAFLTVQAPKIFATIEDSQRDCPTVTVSPLNNIFGANFTLETPSVKTKLWLGINVDRVIVIYFIKGLSVEQARDIYAYTFGGAETVGYNVNYEQAEIANSGEQVLSIWCTWPKIQNSDNLATELLNHPEKKLFIIQDIAMMTQSFIRTSQRAGVDIFPDADPEPL